jgi:hypothetical protein
VLGNPPWETLQPTSKEFFSNIDPMYRSYGNQEALARQDGYFVDPAITKAWLLYCQGFNDDGNWVKYVSSPFGDPIEASGTEDRFSLGGGGDGLHDRWRSARNESAGFTGAKHPFRYQGRGKPYTYKLFVELALALVTPDGGRCGLIVPSGLYSDYGSAELRRLLLDGCSWEWLFSFENRDKIFDIHRSYKFNPVIVVKGGKTASIHTAFMRHKLEDWEQAEAFVTGYTRAQVDRFSPGSKVILEIQSARDLEILEKIYANSVLLGDDGPDGWQVKYSQGDFNMTSDSKLFPPRPVWEAQDYRPDEYSRWLKGDWRPIADLWPELGIDPSRVAPIDPACERRIAATDVQRTEWRLRCTRPPYDNLPIPRADIPAGIILSREGNAWLRKGREDVALPLYQGIMIQAFMPSARGWLSGTGLTARWNHNSPDTIGWNPQYLMSASMAVEAMPVEATGRIGYREVARSTDARSFIGAVLPNFPAGHKVPILSVTGGGVERTLSVAGLLNSFTFDWLVRERLGAAALAWYVLAEATLPKLRLPRAFADIVCQLNLIAQPFSPLIARLPAPVRGLALTRSERLRTKVLLDAASAAAFGLSSDDLRFILDGCDFPVATVGGSDRNPRGFWRVDRSEDPELRHTVLTLVAFQDLETKVRAAGGDREKGIGAFLSQNDGEGWMLPDTLRLADYGLGHDERAIVPQPVASRLGPRFYDWQLAQTPEESWRECELHASNLASPPAPELLVPSSPRTTNSRSLFRADGDD